MSKDQSPTEQHRRMRSLRRALVVVATIAALTMLAPTASAAAGNGGRAFHLAKTCDNTGCTVTSSSDPTIAVDTLITYQGDSPDALVATVNAEHGTAVGHCDILAVFLGTGPGHCVFTGGTAALQHFSITFEVTLDGGTGVWYWDGTFDRGNS
jgi:hypothetical protein